MYLEHNPSPILLPIGIVVLILVVFLMVAFPGRIKDALNTDDLLPLIVGMVLISFPLVFIFGGIAQSLQDQKETALSLKQQTQEVYGISLSDENAKELINLPANFSGTTFGSTIILVDDEPVQATLVQTNGKFSLMRTTTLAEFDKENTVEFEPITR